MGRPLSPSAVMILREFLACPDDVQYGYGLMKATGVASGTLYVTLARFERLGWIKGREETARKRLGGAPQRRVYRLTKKGRHEATAALQEFYCRLGVSPDGAS
jgi:PadR family transcriptional regulator PadR